MRHRCFCKTADARLADFAKRPSAGISDMNLRRHQARKLVRRRYTLNRAAGCWAVPGVTGRTSGAGSPRDRALGLDLWLGLPCWLKVGRIAAVERFRRAAARDHGCAKRLVPGVQLEIR